MTAHTGLLIFLAAFVGLLWIGVHTLVEQPEDRAFLRAGLWSSTLSTIVLLAYVLWSSTLSTIVLLAYVLWW